MASSRKIEIEKFNGQIFDLWKLNMEDPLVDKYQWITVDPDTKPIGVTDEEWKKLDQKAKSTIRLCVSDSVLLNVSGEATVKDLWDKLGNLYQSKSLVNKLFLREKLHNLRMKDGDLVTENLNVFNTVLSQLSSVDIKISNEDKCISLLCSLPNSWDSLVITLGSNATALQFDEIVSALLTEEMRWKNMESQNGDALSVRGRSQNRNKNKSSSGRSKSRGRSQSPRKIVKVVCWKCRKEGHFKRDCKSKAPHKGKGFDNAPSAEVKTTSDEGGDVNTWIYFLKKKSEVFDKFKEFKALVENQIEKKIKVLSTDNGGEFCSNGFEEFCKKCGIARKKTTPYTPQQNGVTERLNKTLMERARSMLSGAKLGQEFWVEAVDTACYLVNRSPSSALEDKTPQQVWTGKKPSLSHLRVFGCDAYVHVPKEKQTKLDNKLEKCIFIEYKDGLKSYKIWNPVTRKVVYNRDVVFREVKDVIKHEVQPKEPEKIEFELKEEESNS
eukprot:PITA_02681